MRRLFFVSSTTILFACAGAPLPERRPALDPSNPDAPESKPLLVSTALSPETALADEAGRTHEHDGHQHEASHEASHGSSDPGVADYTCPMHPEVSQAEPGQCPKCGMALVPRKQKGEPEPSKNAAPPPHEHHREHGEPR